MTRQSRQPRGLVRGQPVSALAQPPIVPAQQLSARPQPPGARVAEAPNAIAGTMHVALACEQADGVLLVIATTLKRGATYHDSWSISPSLALASVTIADTSVPDRPSYVSRAVVGDSSLDADTTYTFSYAIVMRAGADSWAGSGSIAVTVDADGALAEIPAPLD